MQGKKQQIIWINGRLLTPGRIRHGDKVYAGMRLWQPERSKIAALCHLGYIPEIIGAKILYLGASAGTTVSYVADYAEVVYAVEFSRRPMVSLINVCQDRMNIIPIFGDARYPGRYYFIVEIVAILIQDIAQRDQVEILLKNIPLLKNGGIVILFLKMQCMGIDINQGDIIKDATERLDKAGIRNITVINMEKYYIWHTAVIGLLKK